MLQAIEKEHQTEHDPFPRVDPGVAPLGARVLVQVRTVAQRTKSGLYLAPETRTESQWNTQIAKVVALGPLAFCNRETGRTWTEGMWAQPGDYVRVPRWGGDRWERSITGSDDVALFVMFDDHQLIGRLTVDHAEIADYIL